MSAASGSPDARTAAVAAAPPALTALAGAKGAEQAARSTAEAEAAMLRLLAAALVVLADWLHDLLRRTVPDLATEDAEHLDRTERVLQQLYELRSQARVRAGIARIARLEPEGRPDAVRALMRREQHYAQLRGRAVLARALAARDRSYLRRVSPAGAVWVLSPFVRQHTADCLAMAGRAWSWRVLDSIRPPLHAGCPCRLAVVPRGMTVLDPEPVEVALRILRLSP